MNTRTITQADRINQLVIDGLVLENLELRNRITDLEDERDRYRMWFQRSVHVMHGLIAQNDRQSDRIIEQGQAILELRAEIQELCFEVQELRATLTGHLAATATPRDDDGKDAGPSWVQ